MQGGGVVSAIIWQLELVADQGYAQGPDGVPPSGRATDHGDGGEMRVKRGVGIPIGRGGIGSHGDPPHWGVHQEAVDDHRG